ncbi:unnamed protein product, partial [marine sediment metagenome]
VGSVKVLTAAIYNGHLMSQRCFPKTNAQHLIVASSP